jgi:hypothetical protein
LAAHRASCAIFQAAQADEVGRSKYADDMRRRSNYLISSRMAGPQFGRAAGDAMTLIRDLQGDTIQAMIKARVANDGGASMNKLMKDHVIMRRDPNRYSQALSNVMMHAGTADTASGWFGSTDMAIRTNPLTSNFVSAKKRRIMRRDLRRSRTPLLTGEDRGELRRTMMDGILSPVTVELMCARPSLASCSVPEPNAVAGGLGGLSTPDPNDIFDAKRMTGLVGQFQRGVCWQSSRPRHAERNGPG